MLEIESVADLSTQEVDEILLYTDGSFIRASTDKAENSGWGVTVIAKKLDSELFKLESSGPACTDTDSCFYFGADHHSNNTVELRGICEAILWLK